MFKKIFLFFAFVPLAAFSDQDKIGQLEKIKNKGELKVCTTAGYAPFEVKTSKGKWVGFDIEMFEKFTKRINVKLNMVDMRWEGVFPALLSSKCDFITGGMSVTDDRKKVIHFSDTIYKSGNSLVISSRDKDKYKTLQDLDKTGVKIAAKTGNTGDLFLQKNLKNAKVLRFDTNSDMLTAVLENRADAFAQDTVFAFMASNEHKGKLVILPEKLNYEDLAVGLRKQDTDLLEEFNTFLLDWKKSGGYDKAVIYYIESDQWTSELKK
jgi:ABC-type amino acid transport substrate-binding protein